MPGKLDLVTPDSDVCGLEQSESVGGGGLVEVDDKHVAFARLAGGHCAREACRGRVDVV